MLLTSLVGSVTVCYYGASWIVVKVLYTAVRLFP